jgi:hypothetical protein
MEARRYDALRLFAEVSKKYPASITAQSAAIALVVQKDRNLLDSFGDLSSDAEALEIIRIAAKRNHLEGKRKNKKSKAPIEPDDEQILGVLSIIWRFE